MARIGREGQLWAQAQSEVISTSASAQSRTISSSPLLQPLLRAFFLA